MVKYFIKLDQLLKNPIILKRIEYFKALNVIGVDDFKEDSTLLQTIKIPKNMLYLTDKLPSSNYEKNNEKRSQNQSFPNNRSKNDILPDIVQASNRAIPKEKNEKENIEKMLPNQRQKPQINESPTSNTINHKENSIVREQSFENRSIEVNIKSIKRSEINKPIYNSNEIEYSRLMSLENNNKVYTKKKRHKRQQQHKRRYNAPPEIADKKRQ